ncbi:MAG: hypothetical protein ABL889_19300 [Terricaulis sp.]
MATQHIGASARFFCNALTLVLSSFGCWGWCAEVQSWPPRFSDVGVIAMAAITLTTQQLANAMAARAFYALQRGAWMSAVGGVALALVFASATAFGVEHAFMTSQRLMRAEAAAEIAVEVTTATADARAANARLMDLPTNIPASRLVVLQAPLRAALETAEAKEADARARYVAATAPPENDALFQRIFELLSFCELGLYWVLAASHPTAPSQSQQSAPSQETPHKSRRANRGVLRALLSGATLAWSAAAPGAARPVMLPRAPTSIVGAAPPPHAPSAYSPKSRSVPNTSPARVPRAAATGRDRAIGIGTTEPPPWLDAARALRTRGLSYRAIEARIGVPKSTVFRWLGSR